MAQTTVRIDEATHALLSELAKADGVTLHEELTRAVMARRKERFFEEMEAGYAAMAAEERAEDAAEAVLWDRALGDGIEE
jgi:hypothetical protein